MTTHGSSETNNISPLHMAISTKTARNSRQKLKLKSQHTCDGVLHPNNHVIVVIVCCVLLQLHGTSNAKNAWLWGSWWLFMMMHRVVQDSKQEASGGGEEDHHHRHQEWWWTYEVALLKILIVVHINDTKMPAASSTVGGHRYVGLHWVLSDYLQRTNILMLMSISVLTKALVLLRMWWSLFNSNGNSSPVQNLHVCRHTIVLVISKLDWTVVQMRKEKNSKENKSINKHY